MKKRRKKVANCKSCGAEIVWVKTNAGKNHPVNAEPEKRIILLDGGAQVMDAYTSHFATCPDADKFRKKKG